MAPYLRASLLFGLVAVASSHEAAEALLKEDSQGPKRMTLSGGQHQLAPHNGTDTAARSARRHRSRHEGSNLLKSHYLADRLQPMLAKGSPHEKFAYCACMAVIATLLGLAYKERGSITCVGIVLYVLSLSLMSVSVKNVFAHGFKFPQFMTAFHFLSTATVSCLILLLRDKCLSVPQSKTLLAGIFPVSMCTALSIGMANLGLLHCSAHFYEMFSSLTCLITAGVGLLFGKSIDRELYLPLLCITGGLLFVSYGEIHVSTLAVIFVFFAMIFRATKAQLQSFLMSPASGMQQLAPLQVVMWGSFTSFLIMSGWSAIAEGVVPFSAIQKNDAFIALVASTIPACTLNIAAVFVLKELGPVALQAVGTLKGPLACAGAVAVFGEVITVQQMAGYSVLLCACFWYNQVDAELKRKAKAGPTDEKTPLMSPGLAKAVSNEEKKPLITASQV